jgi:hypothetical protein
MMDRVRALAILAAASGTFFVGCVESRTVADLDGDGRTDLALAGGVVGKLSVLLSRPGN